LAGVGHFPQREAPREVLAALLHSFKPVSPVAEKKVQSLGQMQPVRPGRLPQRIRLNQSSDKLADNSVNTAAASASNPDISVSFFSTVRRELRVS